jgi:hypothetical protein
MLEKLKSLIKRPATVIILISLGITLFISSFVGLSGYLMFNKFWGFFLIGLCVQFIAFAIINTFLQRRDTIDGAKIVNEQLEALSRFTIRVSCAYCQIPNVTPIQLNQENRFKCEYCNQVNSIKMQFFAAQVTTPLEKIVMPIEEQESIEFKA